MFNFYCKKILNLPNDILPMKLIFEPIVDINHVLLSWKEWTNSIKYSGLVKIYFNWEELLIEYM